MLVDAQHLGANRRMVLTRSSLEAPEKVALYRRRADALPPSQTAPVDAIQVLLIDHFLETLTGSLEGLYTWQLLTKGAAAIPAAALAHL
jgi:hypothetical protein